MRWTIRKKLTSIILILVFISIGFLGGPIYRVARKSLEERIGQGMRVQASSMINQLDRILFDAYRNIQDWAGEERMLDVISDDSENRIADFLAAAKKDYAFYSDLIFADNTGRVVASSNPSYVGKSVASENWFKDTLSTQKPRTLSASSTVLENRYSTLFVAPVESDKVLKKLRANKNLSRAQQNLMDSLGAWKPKSFGVVAAFLNWSQMIELVNGMPVLESKDQTKDAFVMLMSDKGFALTQPFFENTAMILQQNFVDDGFLAAKRVLTGESGYTVEKGLYGKESIIGYAPSQGFKDFQGFGWAMLVFQSTDHALRPIHNLQFQIMLIGLLVLVIASMISFFAARGITRPIEKLTEFMRAAGRGDFSKKLDIHSRDEIGMLAASFDEMLRNLKTAETEITAARDFTDNIIKSIGDALLVLDREGKIKTCNPALKTVLGFGEKELVGFSVDKILSEDVQKDSQTMLLLKQGNLLNRDMECKNKEGESIPMLVSAAPLRDLANVWQGVVLVARDMREYKSLELQFREAQKMDAVGRLAGGIAHDFNNMLTVINGYSERFLRKIAADDPRGGEIGQILKAGKRAARLVGQLLAFSRRQIVTPAIIDLNELLVGMTKLLKLITGETIELVTLPAQGLWYVKLDAGQFEQVVANLTVNARDAMPDGGKLIFETKNVFVDEHHAAQRPGMKSGEYVLLDVKDTGTGMSEEIKKRVFEPFFTTKPKGKGTGLGLATCYSVVKQSGGYVDVESELGKGTTFKIYLPRAQGKPQSVGDKEVYQALPTGTEKILLVEDEDLVREFAQRLLTEQGYKVLTAINGSDAMRVSEEHKDEKIDLLLTDIVMPKMGGHELAERLKKERPGTKVLFVSGYVDDDMVQETAMNESSSFLQKPITPTSLAVKVRQVLDHGKSL